MLYSYKNVYILAFTQQDKLNYCRVAHRRVLGQNGSGQNGTDKMVWTKWYTDKMVLDKMVQTKWYRQNGTDKMVQIKSSFNLPILLPLTILFFHQSRIHF